MLLFRDVGCHFYSKKENGSFKVKELDCKVVCQSGNVSFVMQQIGILFLLDENVLRKALLDYKGTETNGVYINFTNENVVPIKCRIKLDVTTNEVKIEILNTNRFIETKTEYLRKVLEIK
jgi:hypothetical protein